MTREEKAIIYFKEMRKRLCEDHLKICPKDSIAYKATLAEKDFYDTAINVLEQTRWIPVSERLPEDLEPVNITWVNHEPEPYYHDLKDRNFVATGIYYRGKWYWYSTTCADYLGEYGSNDIDKVDDAVEIVAWMPLPEPMKVGEK